jgi:hypothetical protein
MQSTPEDIIIIEKMMNNLAWGADSIIPTKVSADSIIPTKVRPKLFLAWIKNFKIHYQAYQEHNCFVGGGD